MAEPIDTIKPLTEDTYQPAAATPLIDASVKIINATDDAVKKRGDDPNVLIVFQTDGEENVSVEYTNADLAMLIKEKTAAGWQFLFLGAGIDAFAAARDAGITIDAGHHVSYQRHLSREAFAETAANTRAFAVSGLATSLNYSRAQRARVGDTHTEKHLDPTAKPRQESTPTKRIHQDARSAVFIGRRHRPERDDLTAGSQRGCAASHSRARRCASAIWSGVMRVARALRTRPVLSRPQLGQRTVVSPSSRQRAPNTDQEQHYRQPKQKDAKEENHSLEVLFVHGGPPRSNEST